MTSKRDQTAGDGRRGDGLGRRAYLASIGAAGAVALAGCGGGGGGGGQNGGDGGSDGGSGGDGGGSTDGDGGGGGQLTLGVSNFTSSNPLEVLLTRSAEWWAEDKGYSVTTAAADGTTSTQLSDARNLLQQGVDGLLLTASDSSGMATIVDEAEVPVFSCDIPTYHEDIPLHTAIDQFDFGRTTGQELVETMRDQHPDVSQYKVLEILMDQDNSNAVMRHRSFNNAIDEHDDVEVVKQIEIDGYAATDVQQKASSWFQTDPEFHGIGAPWFGGPIGCMRAMEQQDMLHPAGEEGHISIVNMDAIPTIIDAIKDGFIDKTVGQAIRWYSVISMKYMIDYIEAGEDGGVLPSVGDTIERGDLNLAEGTNEHLGNPIFDPPEPRWPPAEVVEFETFGGESLGFPFVKVNIPVVTQENADDWWLDANLTRHL